MFALDLTNYSRWLPVHIRDLLILNEKHPSVFAEFVRGKFVVQKSQHFFSLIALDHNHEQENEIIKGDGRAVGLTKNPIAHDMGSILPCTALCSCTGSCYQE